VGHPGDATRRQLLSRPPPKVGGDVAEIGGPTSRTAVSDRAANLEDDATPTRRVGAVDSKSPGADGAPLLQPRPEPGRDLRWEMTDRIPVPMVDPDAGIAGARRIRNQHQGLPVLHPIHVAFAVGECDAVDRGAEFRRLSEGKRRHAGVGVRVRGGRSLP